MSCHGKRESRPGLWPKNQRLRISDGTIGWLIHLVDFGMGGDDGEAVNGKPRVARCAKGEIVAD